MDGEKKKVWLVQYLVMLAFVGPRPDGYCVDHINRIRDDNRISNLRYVTRGQNSHNRITSKTAFRTQFRGVVFKGDRANTKPWVPVIRSGGKRRYGKYFSNPEDAAAKYDEMAIAGFGEAAITNKSLGLI